MKYRTAFFVFVPYLLVALMTFAQNPNQPTSFFVMHACVLAFLVALVFVVEIIERRK